MNFEYDNDDDDSIIEFNFCRLCIICRRGFYGHGHNAAPIAMGRCCDTCQFSQVIPARFNAIVQFNAVNFNPIDEDDDDVDFDSDYDDDDDDEARIFMVMEDEEYDDDDDDVEVLEDDDDDVEVLEDDDDDDVEVVMVMNAAPRFGVRLTDSPPNLPVRSTDVTGVVFDPMYAPPPMKGREPNVKYVNSDDGCAFCLGDPVDGKTYYKLHGCNHFYCRLCKADERLICCTGCNRDVTREEFKDAEPVRVLVKGQVIELSDGVKVEG